MSVELDCPPGAKGEARELTGRHARCSFVRPLFVHEEKIASEGKDSYRCIEVRIYAY